MKKCCGKSTLFFLVLLLASFISNAQITWDGSSSTDWNTTANWSTNSVPTSSDDVIIPDVTNDPVLSSSSDVCKDMTIQNGAILTSNNSSYKLTASSITVNDGGSLVISNGDVEITGTSDINGILEIGTGTFDANGTFDATDGSVTFSDAGRLELAGTVTSLGTLTELTGTVEYNGGTQNVLAEDYYNLVIDQSGNKTAQGVINVANNMTISNSASFLTSTNTIDVSGATTVDATLEIGNALYNSRGGFSATGDINFSHGGGKLRFYTVSPTSLGILDNTLGTVVYMSGATNVLSDDYYTLTIDNGGTAKTLQGDASLAGNLNIKSGNELNLGNNIMTITGTSDIDGVLDFNNGGQFRANGTFDATGGTVQFTGSGGSLRLGGATVTSLGNTFTEGTGSVRYNHSGNQIVLSETYYNLGIKNAGTKSAGGALDIDGTLNIFPSGELAMGTYDADVASGNNINIDGTLSITTGTFTTNSSTSDIDGTLTINGAGIYDADGTFDATNGTVQFTGSGGTIKLGGETVTSLGNTLTEGTGTIEYDGGAQNVLAENYYNLDLDGGAEKDLTGNTAVNGILSWSADVDMETNGHTLTITQTPSGYSNDRLIRGGSSSTVSVAYQSASNSLCFIPLGIDGALRTIGIAPASAETFTVVYTPGSPGTINWNTTPTGAPVESGGPVAHVNNHYYYDISRAGSVNADIYMSFLGLTAPSSTADMYMMHWNSSNNQWERLTTYVLRTASTVAATATSFSPFTQGSGGSALPIDLVSFNGECEDNRVDIEFTVASQQNNDYFSIYRSQNTTEWSTVGEIEGAGNTSTQMTYNWVDDNPMSGNNYYKLVQTDYDGTSEGFDPIAVRCESSPIDGYSVYPNPADEVLNIDIELTSHQGNDVEIEIMDINGRVIQSQNAQLDRGYNHLEVDLSEIPSGLYMINFAGTKDYIRESRIIKQ